MFFRPRLIATFPLFARRYRPRVCATANKNGSSNSCSDGDNPDEFDGIDIDMDLAPVDVKKLALPLHNVSEIPLDVLANLRAKDRTLVFSPSRRHTDIVRRLSRLRHEMSIQPLCRVLHLRPQRPDGAPLEPKEVAMLTRALGNITRFVITDERWPSEVSLEVSPYLERSGGTASSAADVLSEAIHPLLRDELHIRAHAGAAPTAVLAKMACDACAREPLPPQSAPSATNKKTTNATNSTNSTNSGSGDGGGGIIALKEYRLDSHDAVERFVRDVPVAAVPSVGAAQVALLRDVYGITTCGEIAAQAERLCFSLSPETMRYFMGVACGLARVPAESTSTLLKRGVSFRPRQMRRESQFGRIISDEQFLETVSGVFEALYKELISYDLVCGRVTLETRRVVPHIRWVVEESANITPRTNDRGVLRENVMELAKRFAPRRTSEWLDPYNICVHFGELRLWGAENEEKTNVETKSPSRKPRRKNKVEIIHM